MQLRVVLLLKLLSSDRLGPADPHCCRECCCFPPLLQLLLLLSSTVLRQTLLFLPEG